MAGKKGGENSKKAEGQQRKADKVARKAAEENDRKEEAEAAEWTKGAKSNAKKEAEAAKKAEQARKKAEREALLAEEEKNTPGRAQPKNAKTAVKKSNKGLDLSQLDGDEDDKKLATLEASGIDNALDALSLTAGGTNDKIDRHPERRFKAAYAAFEERRLKEMEDEKGLRLNQKKERIKKEFEKSPENPFNQVNARYDSTKEEIKQIHEQEKGKIEKRLAAKD